MVPKIINGPKGLKILICPKPESLSVSILVLVNIGTDWENKNNNGLFHFIEHLYFKGTKRYPSPKILMEAIDDIGGSFNAFTSHEYTGYYLKVLQEYTFEALDILLDVILEPLLLEEEIEKERLVIYEEINLHRDRPQDLIIELGFRLAFGDQPAGWSILGSKKTISRITKEDILESIRNYYSTRNTLIVLSGKLTHLDKILNFIFKRFKNYPSHQPRKKTNFKKPAPEYKEKVVFKDVEQAHLFLSFPLEGILRLKQKRIPISLISLILGEKASSRLWLKVREELGAAYYIRSHFSEYTDRSLLFIQAGLNLDRLEFILKEMIYEITRFKLEAPTFKELQTSKAVLKSSLFMDLEDSLAAANFYGRQFLLEKKIKTAEEISKEIDRVDIEDLKRELKNLFLLSQVKLAAILPKGFKINFAKIFKEALK